MEQSPPKIWIGAQRTECSSDTIKYKYVKRVKRDLDLAYHDVSSLHVIHALLSPVLQCANVRLCASLLLFSVVYAGQCHLHGQSQVLALCLLLLLRFAFPVCMY